MCRIKRRSFLGSSAALIGSGLAAAGPGQVRAEGHDRGDESAGSVRHHASALSLMTECANRFLAALAPEQRTKTTFAFADDERLNWHYIPRERRGLPLRDMAAYQKHLASALLASGLSQSS